MDPDRSERTERPSPVVVPSRRSSPRYPAHTPVELRAGGATLEGFVADVSEQGVRVRLPAQQLRARGGGEGVTGYLQALDRDFSHEVDIWWPNEGVRTKARLIRLVSDAKAGGEVVMGLRFVAPLPKADWDRIRP